uniref:Uncharacterized protein n=1 Tax=Arundo donax TaxID=35708 RepID=A0A0A9BC41_ARUDO
MMMPANISGARPYPEHPRPRPPIKWVRASPFSAPPPPKHPKRNSPSPISPQRHRLPALLPHRRPPPSPRRHKAPPANCPRGEHPRALSSPPRPQFPSLPQLPAPPTGHHGRRRLHAVAGHHQAIPRPTAPLGTLPTPSLCSQASKIGPKPPPRRLPPHAAALPNSGEKSPLLRPHIKDETMPTASARPSRPRRRAPCPPPCSTAAGGEPAGHPPPWPPLLRQRPSATSLCVCACLTSAPPYPFTH